MQQLNIMQNILRNILTWFLKVKKIKRVFLEFFSNWLRLITLCKNVTLFWSCGPDCIGTYKSDAKIFLTYETELFLF